MQICKNCRRLFDPSVVPGAKDHFADDYICSWHFGVPEHVGSAGSTYNYADTYRWSCCGKLAPGAVIGEKDYPPSRTPGCRTGPHIADDDLSIVPELSNELSLIDSKLKELEAQRNEQLLDLQNRLSEIAQREAEEHNVRGVFISYSHQDAQFVDLLTRRLTDDKIDYWRDDKDLLIGEVIDKAISDGIQRHALFLIVLSSSSIGSTWVNREFDEASHEAAEGRKMILPVLTSGLGIIDLPGRIRRFKCADFSTDFDKPYLVLKHSIQEHLRRFAGTAQQIAGREPR